MDQPIFYGDEFILSLTSRDDLNMAYKILRTSYEVLYQQAQAKAPKSVAELKDFIVENTKEVIGMNEVAIQRYHQLVQQAEEQEKGIPTLQQMFEITQKKISEKSTVLKEQIKHQKEENTQLKQMYNKISSQQEDEFNAILEEAQKPLEEKLEELKTKKEELEKEVKELKENASNKEDIAQIEEQFNEEKTKMEEEIKELNQRIAAKNSDVQKIQGEVDHLIEEAQSKDESIQRLNTEMIAKDTEIKKLRAELEGKIVDSYA